jgi:diguanylate cyclase (GGDEF)-like protein/PAS domain S-box-containing protein
MRWHDIATANLWLAVAYLAASWAGFALAPDDAHPAALAPAMGVALAALFSFGWRLLPGLAVAALLAADPRLFPTRPDALAAGWQLTLLLGGAAVLQVAAGAALLRRRIDPALASGRDVLRFVLLAIVASAVRASVSLGGMELLGAAPPGSPAMLWLNCWAADSTATLLLAPLCWVLFGRPRGLWRRRHLSVAMPLVLTAASLVVAHNQTVRWEQARQLQAFRLKAQEVGQLMQAALHEHERFLSGVARALDGYAFMTPGRFSDLARFYLRERPELLAMIWLPRVPGPARAAFEAAAAQQLGRPFHILELSPGGAPQRMAAERDEYFPLLYVAPNPERLAHGADFLSERRRAALVRRAAASALPTVSEPLRFSPTGVLGVHLLQAVGAPGRAPDGMLGLALRVETYVGRALASSGFAFQVELTDVTPGAAPLRMLDTLAEDYRPPDHRAHLRFGGREYLLRLAPAPHYLADASIGWQASGVLLAGLVLSALVSALMLVISGERALIEAQVDEATARLREREGRLQAILDNAGDAIVTTDARGELLTLNRAAARLFRASVASLRGQSMARLLDLPPGDAGAALRGLAQAELHERELSGIASDGEQFPLLISVSPVSLSAGTIFVCIMHDLTEQRRAQAHIHQLAHRDALTGLENRLSLTEHLEQLVAQARRGQTSVALLFLDLDHFKKINDSQGHHAGDLLLIEVAHRLRELLRDVDIIARLGGDEFIVAMSGALTPELVGAVALRVVHALTQPYHVDGKTLHSGTSVGIAMFPGDADNTGTLMRHADMAMYAAKSMGRGNFQFFSQAMNAATHERLAMENRLRQALGQREFELYLQPQVHLASGQVVGAEALLRWHHGELGLVMPERMIPVAEESGLILPVGDWVMEEAVKTLSYWKERGLGHLRLAVNLSARQCHGRDLLPRLDALLAESQVAPSQLELEITESAAMHDPEYTRGLLRQLRTRGIQVAIDDFGTGYSSLNYLKLFAIDRIKIDRAFVTDIETDPNDAVIVSATIGLAHALGLAVIAEGVETPAQRGFLAEHVCDEAQGFLFAQPMPAGEFIKYVDKRKYTPTFV